MKRILVILLSVICIAGVVALGYVIFKAKSIEDVQIEGQMQTLYLAGQDIDFQEAKLKVTYKNGNIKMVNMNSKSVKVSLFSTSHEKYSTMKITYKSHVLEVPYAVMKSGLYYLSNYEYQVVNGETNVATYDEKSCPTLIYLHTSGELDYYYRENGKDYMHDGSYDKSYKYTIKGDTLVAELGKKDRVIAIKAHYNEQGSIAYKFTDLTTVEGLTTKKEVSTFTHYELKTNRRITSCAVNFSKTAGVENNIVTFNQGDTIKSSKKVILLKLHYGDEHMLFDVNVHITDEMVTGFRTDLRTDAATMNITYDGLSEGQATIHYRVI